MSEIFRRRMELSVHKINGSNAKPAAASKPVRDETTERVDRRVGTVLTIDERYVLD